MTVSNKYRFAITDSMARYFDITLQPGYKDDVRHTQMIEVHCVGTT